MIRVSADGVVQGWGRGFIDSCCMTRGFDSCARGAGLRLSVLDDRIRQRFDSCAVCAALRLSVLHDRIRCYVAGYEEG